MTKMGFEIDMTSEIFRNDDLALRVEALMDTNYSIATNDKAEPTIVGRPEKIVIERTGYSTYSIKFSFPDNDRQEGCGEENPS